MTIFESSFKKPSKKKINRLSDYQRQARAVHDNLLKAYQEAIELKLMFDGMEIIPTQQQPLYDLNLKTIDKTLKAKDDAYNVWMRLQLWGKRHQR